MIVMKNIYIENDSPKFEETDLERASEEELKDDKRILFPLIPDDQFVDKMALVEQNDGKKFKDIYRSFFEKDEKKPIEKLRSSIRILLDDNKKRKR